MMTMHVLKAKNMQLFILLLLGLWITFSYDVAMAAKVTTDALRYVFGTPINLSWNYTSDYTVPNDGNFDVVAILYNDTVPNATNLFQLTQMFVAVGSLIKTYDQTIRNIGNVTFDVNAPDESLNQAWPLQTGHYKAYIANAVGVKIYAVSDTFTVVPPFLSTNKQSYYFNEPITLSWEYRSDFTGTGERNDDFIGIYDATIANVDLLDYLLYVWVSSLENGSTLNTTIRNNGTVTFDSRPPNESGTLSWPLPVGSYRAILFDFLNAPIIYTESDTFVVVPATASPTKAPTTTSPSIAPMREKKQLFCNVPILKYIFCSDRCGIIGRLLKIC